MIPGDFLVPPMRMKLFEIPSSHDSALTFPISCKILRPRHSEVFNHEPWPFLNICSVPQSSRTLQYDKCRVSSFFSRFSSTKKIEKSHVSTKSLELYGCQDSLRRIEPLLSPVGKTLKRFHFLVAITTITINTLIN